MVTDKTRVCVPSVSPGKGVMAEYHVMSHPRTFPRGVAPDYQGVGVDATLGRRGKTLFIRHGLPRPPPPPLPPPLKTTRVLGHAGGRLVVPNTGERERERERGRGRGRGREREIMGERENG